MRPTARQRMCEVEVEEDVYEHAYERGLRTAQKLGSACAMRGERQRPKSVMVALQ